MGTALAAPSVMIGHLPGERRQTTGIDVTIGLVLGASVLALAGCGEESGDMCDDCGPAVAIDGGAMPDAGSPTGNPPPDAGGIDPSDGGTEQPPLDAGAMDGGTIPPDAGAPPVDAGSIEPPPVEPLLRIPVRVHIGGGSPRNAEPSELTDQELAAIFEEMNLIWYSQAGICFEFETTLDENTLRGENQPGFDLWFAPRVPGVAANGVYFGRRDDVWTRDEPGLGRAPNPVMIPAARTAAHELGHGLSLPHNNCRNGCSDFLMASGTRGWQLLEGARESDNERRTEISDARERAQSNRASLALPDTSATSCAPPVFAPRR